ncbi:hypothetical protein EPN96_01945 [bacterium]|nr:MAG: hypothetical protein EPN96_01945 [bacterium]
MERKEALRKALAERLDATVTLINEALNASGLDAIGPVLARLGRDKKLPHWYEDLKNNKSLPNLDGKTVGSVIEMLLVAVLEKHILNDLGVENLRINPARGVDLPDLDIGIKSPSENYCTSEPFFSAYERLLGASHDALILLTDYQTAKKITPFKLQIIKYKYLFKTQIADENLCKIALNNRAWLLEREEAWAKRVFRFLAYINQSDWRAKILLEIVSNIQNDDEVNKIIEFSTIDYEKKNKAREKREQEIIPESDLLSIIKIKSISPIHLGVIDAIDNWVVETQKDLARLPNDNEWEQILNGPLNGAIGMSFALQWRYNFGRLFTSAELEDEDTACED